MNQLDTNFCLSHLFKYLPNAGCFTNSHSLKHMCDGGLDALCYLLYHQLVSRMIRDELFSFSLFMLWSENADLLKLNFVQKQVNFENTSFLMKPVKG